MRTSEASILIDEAICCLKPARIPVVPLIDIFACRYAGVTLHDMFFNIKKADMAVLKTIEELGRIDGMNLSYAGLGRVFQTIMPIPPILPGINGVAEDEMFQYIEKNVMEADEYSKIKGVGVLKWLYEKMRPYHPELQDPVLFLKRMAGLAVDGVRIVKSNYIWRKRGIEPLVAINFTFTPTEVISIMLRSFCEFTLDQYRHPEEIKAAGRELMKPVKALGIAASKISGIRRVFIGGTRTSASFMNRKVFENVAFPEWLEMSEYFASKGMYVVLHLDSDWTPFLDLFLHMPRRKCILNIDGSTDIWKAKEILGDHMCIMGDVPSTMLRLGEPEEVEDYCMKLIYGLGKDGGFILSSGCTIPPDAKPENVRAMLKSVQKYKP